MKKITILLFVMAISMATSMFAQPTMTFRMTNPSITYYTGYGSYLTFDIEVKADIAGSFLWSGQAILDFNHTSISTNSADWGAVKGPLLQGIYQIPPTTTVEKYETFGYTSNSGVFNIFWGGNVLSNTQQPSSTYFNEVPTSWVVITTVTVKITDPVNDPAGIVFITASMDNQEFYYNGPSSFLNYNVAYDKDFSKLYVGRIYAGGSWYQVDTDTPPDWSVSTGTSIYDGQPVLPGGSELLASALRVNDGAALTLPSNGQLTVSGDMEIGTGSTLTIQSDATGTGSLLNTGAIADNGTMEIQQYITDGAWHLISVPNDVTTANNFLGYYLQTWNEATGLWSDITDPATQLGPVQGYSLYGTPAKATTFTFTGTPNTGAQSIAVTTDGTGGSYDGANLLGNPYPSAIDWNGLRNTWGAVYYWNGTAYDSWNNGGSGSQYVPPMQGFFIVATNPGTFTLDNNNRTHSNAAYYKSETQDNSIVLETVSKGYSDKLFLRLDYQSTADFDLAQDAYKLLSGTEGLSELFSFCNDKKLSIDVRPAYDVLQLGFSNNQNGTCAIGLSDLTAASDVVLEDTKTNTFHDLTQGSYQFTWNTNDDVKRFKLHMNAVGIDENSASTNISIHTDGSHIYITGAASPDVMVTDVMGRILMKQQFNNYENIAIPVDLETGIYLVLVKSKGEMKTQKIFIR